MCISIRQFQRFLLNIFLGNGLQPYSCSLPFNDFIYVLFKLVFNSERRFEQSVIDEGSIDEQVVDYVGDVDEDFSVVFKVDAPCGCRIPPIFFSINDCDLYDQEYSEHDIDCPD